MQPIELNSNPQPTPQAEVNNCSICLEELIEKVETVCHHFFHQQCLNTWIAIENTCPLCRHEIILANPEPPEPQPNPPQPPQEHIPVMALDALPWNFAHPCSGEEFY